jgi:hypothetical protein
VFEKPTTGWADMTETAKLTAGDGAAYDFFGWSVAISGDTVVVGAYQDSIGLNFNQGSAYVFVKPTGGWTTMTQTVKLTAIDPDAGDRFGYSVAISGDTMVVGAYGDDIYPNEFQGSAYVFVKEGSSWIYTAKLVASDGAAYDHFGTSVAVSGDTVVVGADGNEIYPNYYPGSAYVFVHYYIYPFNLWPQMAKLTASDGASDDHFGYSVAISGDTVVVGAYCDDMFDLDMGSAYVFIKPAGGWANMTQNDKLTASDGSPGDWFGHSVSISGDTVAVGVYGDGENGPDSGSAYVFNISKMPQAPSFLFPLLLQDSDRK